ncbi:MAG: hypothetical protein V1755_01710 [Chloroflexota bacterium]
MKFRDAEHLSAYLDGQLSASEISRLEARLAVDAGLRQLLDDLRVARGLLRRVPRRRASRNFALSPLDARVRAPQPRAVPALRYAGAVASLLFLFTVAVNNIAPLAARRLAAAPAAGIGMGGGVGGGAPEAEATEQTLTLAPLGTPLVEEPPAAQDLAAPTPEAFAKAAPPAGSAAAEARPGAPAPIPEGWMLMLAIAGIGFGALSWYIDRRTRRNFRSNYFEK